MGYVTLYRKWRPQAFEDVVGQEHIVRTLTNALKENRVAHAYIFSGPRGTGKTSIAKILAKSLNCDNGPTAVPCNKCRACTEITAGISLDVVEIDAASNRGIDEIRDIREKVKFMPSGGGSKVYIIDEVHMLTPEAFNALLKMLEEPPLHVVFILATTEPHKVLPTILSRCQRFDFRRLRTDELAGQIKKIGAAESIDIDDDSIALIAKQAKGGMRDAVSTLDQLSSYTGRVIRKNDVTSMLGMVDVDLLFKMADMINAADAGAALVFVNDLVDNGWDLRQFTKDLTEHFRNLFVIKNTADPAAVVNATADELAALTQQASKFSPAGLTGAIEVLTALNNEMRYATDPRLLLELALVKMTSGTEKRAESGEPIVKPREELGIKPKSGRSVIARSSGSEDEANSPKPEPEPMPQQPAGSEFDTIKRAWAAVLDKVKKDKMSAFANLLECRPVAVEGKAIVLEFNEKASVHKSRVESESNKKFIEDVVRTLTGKPYVIKCVMGTMNPEPRVESEEPRAEGGEQRAESGEQKAESQKNEDRVGVDLQVDTPKQKQKDETATEEAPPLPETENGGQDMLAALTGMFDATVKETKERTDEG